MKLLNIISSGYRATIEEQDDTVAWISLAMRNAGADIDVLLRGAAANYSVEGQSVKPITLGGRAQKHGPDVHEQVCQLAQSGARIFIVQEDLDDRGIERGRMMRGVEVVNAAEVPALLTRYDRVWHW